MYHSQSIEVAKALEIAADFLFTATVQSENIDDPHKVLVKVESDNLPFDVDVRDGFYEVVFDIKRPFTCKGVEYNAVVIVDGVVVVSDRSGRLIVTAEDLWVTPVDTQG